MFHKSSLGFGDLRNAGDIIPVGILYKSADELY